MDGKWYLSTSTPSYVVQSFVKHSQPRSLRGRQKEYITAFARYYFTKKPSLPPPDLSLLLFGDGERRGLFEACGAMKGLAGGGELRGSAVLSLELLLMLVDCNVNTAHGEEVLDVVVKAYPQPLSIRLLQSMALHRHLAHPTSREFALKLIFILSESCPPLQRRAEWLGSEEAVRVFEGWQKVQLQAQSEAAAAAAAEDDDRELLSWAEVHLDDLDAEDLQVDAALAELIAEVDAEGETEGGQKDPLGIARSLPPSAGQAKGAVQTSAKLGKAAAKKMQILWKQMKEGMGSSASAQLTHGPSTNTSPSTLSTSTAAQQMPSTHPSSPPPSSTTSSAPLMEQLLVTGSTSTDREDFDPVLFLSQVHSASSLDSLQRGLLHLQKSVNNRAAAMKALVAEHFGQYVFCIDTIEHLHQLMKAEVNEKSSRALRIGSALQELNRQCEAAYGGVISAKKGSDRMRETLQTLQHFTFLFALPGEVALHAQQKQYSQVVRDYKKAKAITIPPTPHTHTTTAAAAAAPAGRDLLSLVLLDVFQRISAVRSALFRQLEAPNVALEEQVRAIQWLVELDCDIDPAWYFLQRQTHHIGREMEAAVQLAIEKSHRQSKGSAAQLTSPVHGDVASSSTANGAPHFPSSSASASTSRPRQVNGPSSAFAAAPPPLSASWNPFGDLLALNPSFLSTAASSSSSPSSSSPSPEHQPMSPPPSIPLGSTPPSVVDSVSTSAVPQLIHRLCALLTHSVPSFLRLAHLIATRQLASGGGGGLSNGVPTTSPPGASASPFPLGPPSSPSTATSPSSPSLSLQGVSAEHRQAIHLLLDGVFHQLSAFVRLALFPVTAEDLQRWEAAGPVRGRTAGEEEGEGEGEGEGGSRPSTTTTSSSTSSTSALPSSPAGALSPSKAGLPSSSSSASSSSPPPVDRLVDRSAEHGPFSLAELSSPSSHLPLLDPPLPSSLPLPSSTPQTVHLLLRLHSQMLDLGLPSETLHHLSELRVAVVRWFVASTALHTRTAIESLQGEESWHLVDERLQGRGGGRRSRAATSATNASSARRTALPSRFQSLMRGALTAFTAIPSIKAHWMIQQIAGPTLDCMKAFAHTSHALMQTALEQEDSREEEQHMEEGEESQVQRRGGRPGVSHVEGGSGGFDGSPRRPGVSVVLLLLLSNLRFVRSVVLPGLLSELLSLFPSSTHSVVTDAFSRSVLPAFDELDERLLQHFLRLHLLTLHRRVRDEAYNTAALLFHLHTRVEGGKGSSRHLRVRGVVVDILLDLVHLHSELFFLCPALIRPALQHLTVGLLQSLQFCAQHCHEDAEQRRGEGLEGGGEGEGEEEEEAAVSASLRFWCAEPQLVELALLELHFIARTLDGFATGESTSTIHSTSEFLTRATQSRDRRKQPHSNGESHDSPSSAAMREQQLTVEVRATAAMFHCLTAPTTAQVQHKGRKGPKGKTGGDGGKAAMEGEEEEEGEEVLEEEEEEDGEDNEEELLASAHENRR